MKTVFSALALFTIAVLAASCARGDPFPAQPNATTLTPVSDAVGDVLPSGTVTNDGGHFYGGGRPLVYKVAFGGAVQTSFSTFQTSASTTANFGYVQTMTPIVDGVFFLAERSRHVVIRWDTTTDQSQQLVGSSSAAGYVNGVGTTARFSGVTAVALNLAEGELFATEEGNRRIRRVAATTATAMNQGEAFFVAGTGAQGSQDSTNPLAVTFTNPFGIVVARIQGVKYLYVSQRSASIRRVVAATGATTTIIQTGTFTAGYAATARVHHVYSIAARDDNSIWVSDTGAKSIAVLSWNDDSSEHYLHFVVSIPALGVEDFAIKATDSVSRAGVFLADYSSQRFYQFDDLTSEPQCSCDSALTVDYANTLVPDAAKEAFTTIGLNTNTWEVEFSVVNVLTVTNGHVLAAGVNARGSNVTDSIQSVVSSPFDAAALWTPVGPCSNLSAIDTPAAALGVEVERVAHNCTRNYHVKYSLIDTNARSSHCTLTNNAQNEVQVDCELQLNTIRAYDLTESNAYLAKETVFRTSITMPRNLPNEVSTLLHASLAKCSVYAAPLYYVDCRIPSLWNFASTFSVTQSPSWIIGSSCDQTNGTDATFIRCDLQSISQIFTEATATIGATVLPSGETMHFNVNYSLPREETATATGSLASFVKSIGTKDGKFYYGNDDLLTLEIEVVDTARLQITQLELFNSDSPVQAYDLRSTPDFELVETQNATFFVITFYPARKLDDSNFYLHGPHGVNVSFLFTAARRQDGDAPQAGDKGVVSYSGIGLKAPKGNAATQSSQSNSNASGLSQTAVAAIAAGALVAVVAVVAATVMIVRNKKTAAAPAKEADVQAPRKTVEITDCADVAIEMAVDESEV